MYLRSLLRRLLAMLLMLSLIPGLAEVIETVEHMLHDGHLPHSAEHEQYAEESHSNAGEEHGCTSMVHSCGCHTSSPAILEQHGISPPLRIATTEQWLHVSEQTPIVHANAPPKPPIILS